MTASRRRYVADADPALVALLAACTHDTDPSDLLDILRGTDGRETTR